MAEREERRRGLAADGGWRLATDTAHAGELRLSGQ